MIKQCISKHLLGAGMAGLFLLAGLGFTCLAPGVAGTAYAATLTEGGAVETVVGTVDGIDLKLNRIWINDRRFLVNRLTKVNGTSTKLGLITDLKEGETVKAEFTTDKDGSTPVISIIYRQ